ncbi:MAG: hypothetical protein ACOYON_04425 [Fimbriimonas sp.]
MQCPRCGTTNMAGAAFCMRCGQPFAAAGAPAGGLTTAFDEQQRKQKTIYAIIGTVAMLAIVLLALNAAGILRLGASQPEDPALKRVAKAPAPALVKQSETPPPALEKVAERAVMPPEVRAWLEHLEKTEKQKIEISIQQIADMAAFMPMLQTLGSGIGQLDPYDQSTGEEGKSPDAVTHGKFRDLKPQWEQLIVFFQSVPPPDDDCRLIAEDYSRALSEIPGMTSDIGDVLNDVQSDPGGALAKVSKMKQQSYGGIDRYFEQSDVRLGEICRKYNERKWFNIRTDVGGGMFGSLGK